jgi:hypothetical protein
MCKSVLLVGCSRVALPSFCFLRLHVNRAFEGLRTVFWAMLNACGEAHDYRPVRAVLDTGASFYIMRRAAVSASSSSSAHSAKPKHARDRSFSSVSTIAPNARQTYYMESELKPHPLLKKNALWEEVRTPIGMRAYTHIHVTHSTPCVQIHLLPAAAAPSPPHTQHTQHTCISGAHIRCSACTNHVCSCDLQWMNAHSFSKWIWTSPSVNL